MTGTQPSKNAMEHRRKKSEPRRRCMVTRRFGSRENLIRFVVGPDNRVLPDIAAKLPGRGIWLSADRDVINTACVRGLFAKGFRTAVSVDADMARRVEDLVTERCLGMLGLARRAGDVTLGFERVCEALATGTAGVGLIAVEAAENGRRRLLRVANGKSLLALFTAGELARALGREHVVYGAVTKGCNAARLVVEAGRLAGFRREAVGVCPGEHREEVV